MVKDYQEEPEDMAAAGDSRPPLGEQGTASVRGDSLREVEAERAQLEREMKADAAALETKFGPKPPYLAEAGEGADWIDRGIQDVPVANLAQPDGVSGPEDFDHHISYEDAMRATRRYQKMQPLIAQGYTGDDFSAEDEAAGVPYEQGKRRVYDLYHGSQPIRVLKDGAQYEAESGRHRVYAAKEVGLETVPARVFEKVAKGGNG